MEVRSAAVYALYVLVGFGIVGLGYGLQKRNRHRILTEFSHYLTAGITFGLLDWLAPLLVAELVRGVPLATHVRILFIFGGLALPFLVAKIFFLLSLVQRWMGFELNRPIKAGFAVFSLGLFVLFALDAFEFFVRGRVPTSVHRAGNIFILSVAALVVRFLILLYPLLPIRGRPGAPDRRTLRIFAALSLFGYAFYAAVSFSILEALAPAFYYLVFILPLAYLWDVARKSPEVFAAARVIDLGRLAERFGLTPREIEIASLVLRGNKNHQIGKQLFLSVQSVKNILTRIYQKIGVQGRSEMISKLMRLDDEG
jgi:DNA-binding CsgD family transcriptional regulator